MKSLMQNSYAKKARFFCDIKRQRENTFSKHYSLENAIEKA